MEEEASDKKQPLEDIIKEIPDSVVLIADEFHQCKNGKAKKTLRFKKLFNMVKNKPNGKAIVLTGTPILNRPMELKTLLDNVDLFKKSFGTATNFYSMFGGHFDFYLKRLIWNSNNRDSIRIKEALKNVLFIRKKHEVLKQLPKVVNKSIYVDLSSKHKKELNSLFDKYKNSNILDMSKADFSKYTSIREALSIEKYKNSLETIESFEEAEKPIIVFSDFVIPVESLGAREGWEAITGSTSQKKREEFADKFNRGELKGLAITIKAGSTALSLTGTDTVVFLDLNLVPGLNVQARNRIDRINKLNDSLFYVYFVTNHPMEISISKLLLEKEKLVNETY